MYESPIELITGQIKEQIDNDIVKAVQSYGINVNKRELLMALQYDRQQYEQGYADGKAYALASVVRCKDCRWLYDEPDDRLCLCVGGLTRITPDTWCCYGERREK